MIISASGRNVRHSGTHNPARLLDNIGAAAIPEATMRKKMAAHFDSLWSTRFSDYLVTTI